MRASPFIGTRTRLAAWGVPEGARWLGKTRAIQRRERAMERADAERDDFRPRRCLWAVTFTEPVHAVLR